MARLLTQETVPSPASMGSLASSHQALSSVFQGFVGNPLPLGRGGCVTLQIRKFLRAHPNSGTRER